MKKFINLFCAFACLIFICYSCSSPQKTEEQAAEAPAEEAMEEKAPAAVYGVVVSHSVSDFDKWLESFNAADSVIDANGFSNLTVHRGVEDSMMVTVTGYSKGHEGAKAFINSEETKTNMAESGVVGEVSDSYWDMSWQREGDGETQFEQVMMVRHDVTDAAAWAEKFHEHDSVRLANGIVALVFGALAENPNHIGIYLGVTDLEAWMAFAEGEDLKAKMEEAGVVGEPVMSLLNVVGGNEDPM